MQVTVSYNPFDKVQVESAKTILALDLNKLASEQEGAAEETTPAKKTRGRKAKPETTVSEDEDEDFGKKALGSDDLEEEEDEEESDDEESEDEEDEEALSWDTVKAAINQFGNKKPDEMKAILLSFNFKSTKELQAAKRKWEPVYRKVMAKMKTLKKGK